jgi:hypothetical protein
MHTRYISNFYQFPSISLNYLYQSIASSSFLSLNYPSVYRAFSLNFASAWSYNITNSIERMCHLTGGHLADATEGSAVGFVKRKLSSPYHSHSVRSSPFARFLNNMWECRSHLNLQTFRVSRLAERYSHCYCDCVHDIIHLCTWYVCYCHYDLYIGLW